MATKKKAAKKPATKKAAAKKATKKPLEILIGADGSMPPVTHLSIAHNGAIYWKSADRKLQWEIYFLGDPFDQSLITSPTTGKTRTLNLHKRVADGDAFNYHLVGPLHPRKDQDKVSDVGEILVGA
jgi:hypothetical protein